MLVMWLAGGILVPASGLAMTGYIQTQDAKRPAAVAAAENGKV